MKTLLLLSFLTLLSIVSAYKYVLRPQQTIALRLQPSGTLSYHAEALTPGNWLCVTVAAKYCEISNSDCVYYPHLSSPRLENGYCAQRDDVILPPTVYKTNQSSLFLFISNGNTLEPMEIVYDYNNSAIGETNNVLSLTLN